MNGRVASVAEQPVSANCGVQQSDLSWAQPHNAVALPTQNSTGCADPYLQAHGSVFANTDQYFLFRLCTKF